MYVELSVSVLVFFYHVYIISMRGLIFDESVTSNDLHQLTVYRIHTTVHSETLISYLNRKKKIHRQSRVFIATPQHWP